MYDPLVRGSWNRVPIGFRFHGLLLPLIFVTGSGSICHMTWMGDHIMIGCFMSFHSLWFVSSFEILESSLKDISVSTLRNSCVKMHVGVNVIV